MNGDLRLFRRRWWGSWAIGATALLALCCVPMLSESSAGSPGLHVRSAVYLSGLMLAILVCCYAPWTFFGLVRLFALIGFATTVWYLVDEVRRGQYVTEPGENQSVPSAVHALLLYGLPCMWIVLFKRPRVCPYDERGRSRPFEIERTFRLVPLNPESSGQATDRGDAKRKVKFDYAGLSKLEVLDAAAPALLRVTLPLDATGVAVWDDWKRRLAEVGLDCKVIDDQPGSRSFVNAVLHSVHGRWTRGRRVSTPAERSKAVEAELN